MAGATSSRPGKGDCCKKLITLTKTSISGMPTAPHAFGRCRPKLCSGTLRFANKSRLFPGCNDRRNLGHIRSIVAIAALAQSPPMVPEWMSDIPIGNCRMPVVPDDRAWLVGDNHHVLTALLRHAIGLPPRSFVPCRHEESRCGHLRNWSARYPRAEEFAFPCRLRRHPACYRLGLHPCRAIEGLQPARYGDG